MEKQLTLIADKIYNSEVVAADKDIARELKILLGSLSLAVGNERECLRLFQLFNVKIQELMSSSLYKSYIEAYSKTAISFNLPIDKKALEIAAKQAVNEPWLQRTFRKSIQQNLGKTYNDFVALVNDSVAKGIDVKTLTPDIQSLLNISYNDAKRLIRTETMFQINQAQFKLYQDKGYTRYKILAALDSRTSEVCRELNGKEYFFSEAIVGVNMPPLHPNCRTTIIPVIEGLTK